MRLWAALLLAACATPSNPVSGLGNTYWGTGETIGWVTTYPVAISRRTPAGVAIDDPGGQLDDAAIDRAFATVSACLAKGPRQLTVSETGAFTGMNCHRHLVPTGVDRGSLVVKVAPDWIQGNPEQLFTCSIDDRGCRAKGLKPSTPDNPCMCRHAVQWRDVLVVTPNLKLLPAAIVEAVTTCENPWAGVLARCAAPLPNGGTQ